MKNQKRERHYEVITRDGAKPVKFYLLEGWGDCALICCDPAGAEALKKRGWPLARPGPAKTDVLLDTAGYCLLRGRFDDAMEAALRATGQDPDNGRAHLLLAFALFEGGDPAGAWEGLAKAVNLGLPDAMAVAKRRYPEF